MRKGEEGGRRVLQSRTRVRGTGAVAALVAAAKLEKGATARAVGRGAAQAAPSGKAAAAAATLLLLPPLR